LLLLYGNRELHGGPNLCRHSRRCSGSLSAGSRPAGVNSAWARGLSVIAPGS
jgi:hypothetical protein